MHLNSDYLVILSTLQKNDFVPTEKIAVELAKTNRSIRNYITEINKILNQNGAQIISVYGKGNNLKITDLVKFNSFLKQIQQPSYLAGKKQRMQYYLKNWLFDQNSLNMNDMEELFFLPKKQIRKDWNCLKELFLVFNCRLENKPYLGTVLTGSLWNKMNLVVYIILKNIYGCQEKFVKLLNYSLKEPDILSNASILMQAANKYFSSGDKYEELPANWREIICYIDKYPENLCEDFNFDFSNPYCTSIPSEIKRALYLSIFRIQNGLCHCCPNCPSIKKLDPLAWISADKLIRECLRSDQIFLEDEIGSLAFCIHTYLQSKRRMRVKKADILSKYQQDISLTIIELFKKINPMWDFNIISSPAEHSKDSLLIYESNGPIRGGIGVENFFNPPILQIPSAQIIELNNLLKEEDYHYRTPVYTMHNLEKMHKNRFGLENMHDYSVNLLDSSCILVFSFFVNNLSENRMSLTVLKPALDYKDTKYKVVIGLALKKEIEFEILDYIYQFVSEILTDSLLLNKIIHSESYEILLNNLTHFSECFGNTSSFEG